MLSVEQYGIKDFLVKVTVIATVSLLLRTSYTHHEVSVHVNFESTQGILLDSIGPVHHEVALS